MRPEKLSIIGEIRTKLDGSKFVVLVDYRGLTVEQFGELRKRLRETNSCVFVVKNSFLKRATDELELGDVSEFLNSPTAVVVGGDDVTTATKVLVAFAGEHKVPVLKGGALDGKILTAEDFEVISKIASREVLLGQVVGTIAAPMSGLVGVMNQKLLSLLYVLKAVAEKKEATS